MPFFSVMVFSIMNSKPECYYSNSSTTGWFLGSSPNLLGQKIQQNYLMMGEVTSHNNEPF